MLVKLKKVEFDSFQIEVFLTQLNENKKKRKKLSKNLNFIGGKKRKWEFLLDGNCKRAGVFWSPHGLWDGFRPPKILAME